MTTPAASLPRRSPAIFLLAWAGLCVATLAAYWPALRGGFLWDDDAHVTAPALRSLHGLGRIWFQLGATQQYYPVLHSLFWLEHRLWGDAPLGYHLANIFLHATAAALFALVLRQLVERVAPNALVRPGGRTSALGSTRSTWGVPLFAAFLFALHPVGVESVAWISEQKNTLSAVFYLLAALTYLRWHERTLPCFLSPSYFIATGCFVLALLSKSVTATLPAALLVVLWWRNGRLSWKRDIVPLLPWFVLGGASGLFTAWVERTYIGAQGSDFGLSFLDRVLLAGRATGFYLGKLLWPADLSFVYPRWTVDASTAGQFLFPLGVMAGLAILWLLRGRTRAPLAGALFFVGTLFPALGFFNVYPFVFSYVADHFQYLASLGVFALVAGAWAGLDRWLRPRGAIARPALACLLVGTLGVLTWRQAAAYRDAETLYRTTLRQNPDAWLADACLGVVLADQGQVAPAVACYEQALRLRPGYPQAHYDLGNALARLGRRPEAIGEFLAFLRLQPGVPAAHLNLANVLMEEGRVPEAIAHYREALRLDPNYFLARLNLGRALAQDGRLPEAIAAYALALRQEPEDAEAHFNLGNALANSGRMEEAAGQYEQALRIRPDYAAAARNLAIARHAP